MADDTETRPPARRRRWIIAVIAAVVLIATVGIVLRNREPPQPPAEVWVPASSFQKFGGRPFGPLGIGQFDVRTSPDGARFTGWSGSWQTSRTTCRPCLTIFPEDTRFDRIALMLGGTVSHLTVGGYVDSGDRRDAAGTEWMRMTLLDTRGITQFEWDTESVLLQEEIDEMSEEELDELLTKQLKK